MTKKIVNVEAQTVSFDFENETNSVVALADLPVDIVTKLALHGLSQKCGDSYAGAKQACLESEMNPAEYAKSQVDSVIKQLVEGEWNVRTGTGTPSITDLARALAEVMNVTEGEAAAKCSEADTDQKKALRAHPAIKAVLDRLRAERAAKNAAKSAENAETGPDLSEMFG